MGDVILLGDVHLPPQGGASTGHFVAFLDAVASEVEHVVILGDLFDLWVGRGSASVEAYAEPIRALRALTRRGVRLSLVWGNRDFLLDASFARGIGARLERSSVDLSCDGLRVHATHGDGFLEDDWGYRVLTWVLRNPLGRAVARCLPHTWTWGIGMALRRSSVRSTARKSVRAFTISPRALVRLIARGADLVVCGHVHRHEMRSIRAGGRRGVFVSLEAFGETGAFLRIRGGEASVEKACTESGEGYAYRFRLPVKGTAARTSPESPRGPRDGKPPVRRPAAVIALDGPAGCGKSSVAHRLASRLGFVHLDTGATYRAVTWHLLRRGVAPEDSGALREAIQGLRLRLDEQGRVWIDEEDVTGQLRGPAVGALVSRVASRPEVREALVALQRAFAAGRRVVAEGRDIGTVVFPQARWKFFLDADPRVRAGRRLREEGMRRSLEEVAAEIEARDRLDATRKDGPMRPAAGAVKLDTTHRTLDEIVAWIEERVRRDVQGGAPRPPQAP